MESSRKSCHPLGEVHEAHARCSYSAIDMSTFEALKLAYIRSTGKEEPGVLALLSFGSVSGSIGATSVYPLNLVRTRLQASGSSGHPQRYTGIMDVVQTTYARDGWRGFYRGLLPTLAKVRYTLVRLAVTSVPNHTRCRSYQQCQYLTLCTNLASASKSSPDSTTTASSHPLSGSAYDHPLLYHAVHSGTVYHLRSCTASTLYLLLYVSLVRGRIAFHFVRSRHYRQ